MVNKKLLILTGVLVAGAAVALLVDRKGSGPKEDARLGHALLDGSQAAAVDRIEIKKTDGLVLVRGADNVWHLGDAQGFPVDAGKVVRFLDDLTRATYQMMLSTSKDDLGEFGLTSPTSVKIGAQGKDVVSLALGDNRKNGGQYVAPAGEDKAYLIAQAIAVTPDAAEWEMKSLLDLKKDQVKSVAFAPAAKDRQPVTLTREKKEDPLKVQGQEKESPQAKAFDTQLQGITFAKRYDATNEEAKTALASPSRATVTTFDGKTYELSVGSVGDKTPKYFLKIQAPQGDALNDLMAKYAFEVPQYVAQRFEKGAADFQPAAGKG